MHKLFWFLSGCNSRTSTIQEPGWSRNASGCLFILPQQQTPCFVSQKHLKLFAPKIEPMEQDPVLGGPKAN